MKNNKEKWWKGWTIAIVPGLLLLVVEKSGLLEAISPWLSATASTQIPIPAWMMLGLCIYGIVVSVAYWNATASGRVRLRVLRAQAKGEYHQPDAAEVQVLTFMRLIDQPVSRSGIVQVIQKKCAEGGKQIARRDIEVAFDELHGADWLEYAVTDGGEQRFDLSSHAASYCRQKNLQTLAQLKQA